PATELMPTSSEILPPATTRASTSRPSGSVPSGWAALTKGSVRRAIRSSLSAPPGNSTSEKRTARQMTAVMSTPKMNSKLAKRERRLVAEAMVLLRADTRIDQPVGDVDKQVDPDDQQRKDGDDALQDGVVAGRHRIEGERAEARPVEDPLDDDDATEQSAELDAEIGDERYRAIAQSMLVENLVLAETLGTGHHDILRLQGLEHRGAHQAHIGRRQDDAHGHGGHDVALPAIHAARWQKAE